MVDIFDEVDEDLRAERARRLFGRYGWLIAVAAVLVVGGVAAWQVWQTRRAGQNEAVAARMLAAMRQADPIRPGGDGKARSEAVAAFEDVANGSPEGYRTLARLRIAGLRNDAGDTAGARAEWDQVAGDASADPLMRDLANLLWARQQVDAGDAPAVEARLKPLTDPQNAWRSLAAETQALLDVRLGRADAARNELRRLANDPGAPPNVRSRASGLLAQMGDPSAPADLATDAAAE